MFQKKKKKKKRARAMFIRFVKATDKVRHISLGDKQKSTKKYLRSFSLSISGTY